MGSNASKLWVGLLVLLFAYGASCSALHSGQAGQQGHAAHFAPVTLNPEAAHHTLPTATPEPRQNDLECCALTALSAKNLAQLTTSPEDQVPWVPVLFALLLAETLFPLFNFILPQPLRTALPRSLVQQKTCLLC